MNADDDTLCNLPTSARDSLHFASAMKARISRASHPNATFVNELSAAMRLWHDASERDNEPFSSMKKMPRLRRLSLAAASLAGVFALNGCVAPTPPRPVVAYPVSYQVPVGNTQVSANTGAQNLNVTANQDIQVEPGQTVYYQVVSPVDVVVSVYELPTTTTPSARVAQMQGTTFTSSITPTASALRFSFAASQPNSSGTLRFTLSDRPIAPATTSTTSSY